MRDRSVFVGNPDDVVPASFGPGLPMIRDWVRDNFDFAGYVTGFDPRRLRRPAGAAVARSGTPRTGGCAWSRSAGRAWVSRCCGGSSTPRRWSAAATRTCTSSSWPARGSTRRRCRDDGACRSAGYVPRLYQHLAACDLAVVQGGLTTTMELTANQRPFVYVPLRHHFEQNFHVRHRLERYGAGRCLDYDRAADPDALAAAVVLRARPRGLVPTRRDRRRRPGRGSCWRICSDGSAVWCGWVPSWVSSGIEGAEQVLGKSAVPAQKRLPAVGGAVTRSGCLEMAFLRLTHLLASRHSARRTGATGPGPARLRSSMPLVTVTWHRPHRSAGHRPGPAADPRLRLP